MLRKAGKDDPLAAQGRLKIRTYRKGDETKFAVDLMADNILPVRGEKRRDVQSIDATTQAETIKRPTRELINDDLPF